MTSAAARPELPFDRAAGSPPAGDPAARRVAQRAERRPVPPPPPVARLRGSAAILGHLLAIYTPTGGLPPGSIALLLLDRASHLVAQGRIRDLEPDLAPADQTHLLRETAHVLRHGHPRGRGGRVCLLVVVRGGGPDIAEPEMRWWAALYRACGELGMEAADVLTLTPDGWHTLRAGTSGTEPTAAG